MTPPTPNVPRAEFEPDEITGVIKDPEALKAARAKRPTDERIGRLEAKHDDMDDKLDKLAEGVANINGKLDVVPRLVDLLSAATGAKLEIGKADAASKIEAAKDWRGLVTKVVLGILAIATTVFATMQVKG
jgi:hypothetical protein